MSEVRAEGGTRRRETPSTRRNSPLLRQAGRVQVRNENRATSLQPGSRTGDRESRGAVGGDWNEHRDDSDETRAGGMPGCTGARLIRKDCLMRILDRLTCWWHGHLDLVVRGRASMRVVCQRCGRL